MPIYEYQCETCGTVQEVIAKRGAETPSCPKGREHHVVRRLAPFAIGTSHDPGTFCEKHPDHCTTCPAKNEPCPLPE